MKNISKVIKLTLLAIVVGIGFSSCSDDDDSSNPMQSDSIADIASRTSNLSVLVQALDRAGLVQTLDQNGPFTVFAPTNTAFQNFLTNNGFTSLNDVPVNVLREVLLNHVISGRLTSSQLATGYLKTLGKGGASEVNTLSMFVNTASGVRLNGVSSVSSADISASNGVIHIVDAVIGLPTVVDHALANPNFSSLVAALTRSDMPDFVTLLSGNSGSPFTVFAPTNAAFASLLTELSLSGLGDVPQSVLEKTLRYHVVSGANVLSNTLTDGMMVNTYQGDTFTINTVGGARITDTQGRVSNIVATDVQAANGVVHVLDRVILPNLN